MSTVEEIVETLGLQPHPLEGGYFRETYRSAEHLGQGALPRRYRGDRTFATAIYYLITPDTFSALHRLASDEVFHFYKGDPVEMLQLLPNGEGDVLELGTDLASGQRPQVAVPCGVWQGCRLKRGGQYALLGATVSPGFEYADYEHGDRGSLVSDYPAFREMIEALATP